MKLKGHTNDKKQKINLIAYVKDSDASYGFGQKIADV